MEKVQNILILMQVILAIGEIAVMIYALKSFLQKPKNELIDKVLALEVKTKEIEDSLHQGNDRFRLQKETNEVLIHSTMALIEFEIQYCLTEKKSLSPELQRAKDDLQSYLSRK